MQSFIFEVTIFGVISGKFGRIRAEIFRTPKRLPAPTPMIEGLHSLLPKAGFHLAK